MNITTRYICFQKASPARQKFWGKLIVNIMEKKIKTRHKDCAMVLLGFAIVMGACTKEPDFTAYIKAVFTPSASAEIIELSFEAEATTRFMEDRNVSYSHLDMASMTPNREKQSVLMKIYEKGDVYLEIEKMKEDDPIFIPHKTLPDDASVIHKMVINNNLISFFDKSGNLMSSSPVEMPNQSEMVRMVKEAGAKHSPELINQTIATMQGQQFAGNLEEFIKNAHTNGARIVEQSDRYVTLRTPLSQIDPGLTQESVLLIDRQLNRIVGTRIYDKDKLLMTTLFGYGPPEKPYLTAIKQVAIEQLPSGQEVTAETITRIKNLKFKINN